MYRDLNKCEHWLRAHRLAVAAWNMQHPGPRDLAPVRRYLENELAGAPQDKFNSLPLLTLSLIGDLDQPELERLGTDFEFSQLRSKLAQARAVLIKESGDARVVSIVRGAQLVAELILRPTSNARTVALYARYALDRSWDRCLTSPDLRRALDKVSPLQVAETSTSKKVEAIASLAAVVARGRDLHLNGWPHVEYALLNRLFAWPLCVSSAEGDAPGISYPLSLDVEYGQRADVRIVNKPAITLGEENAPQFKNSMREALDAAKDLWSSENGSAAKALKDQIRDSQLIINTAPAAAITEPFGPGFGAYIAGRSLEAYIAIATLGRLSLIDGFPPVAISGTIEERLDRRKDAQQSTVSPDDAVLARQKRSRGFGLPKRAEPLVDGPGLDRAIGPVRGIVKKYEWTLLSKQFTTVVLPQVALSSGPEAKALQDAINATREDHSTFVETVFASTLSGAADIAFGMRWRRYRSVRASDVLRAMLHPTGPVDRTDKGVAGALTLLQGNRSAILRSSKFTICDVVGALSLLNHDWAPMVDPPQARRSVLFFRMVSDEPRARLLTTLFAAIGAHSGDLQALLSSSTLDEAVSILAKVLNQTEPATNAGFRRAPDILVFILPNGEIKTRSSVLFDEHLEFNRLFAQDTLGVKLNPVRSKQWQAKISNTRILIVSDASLGSFLHRGGAPDKSQLNTYRKLGVFVDSFRQSTASRVLDRSELGDKPVREWLEAERRAGRLAKVAGRYFLSPNCRQALLSNSYQLAEYAQAHVKAALALAPYLATAVKGQGNVSPPGLVHQEAADPAAVHEAQFHFAALDELEAAIKRKPNGEERWRKLLPQISDARYRYHSQLGCIFEPTNWDLARFAVAYPRFASEYLGYAVAATRSLVAATVVEGLPAIRLTASLGLYDKYLSRLRGDAAVAAREELAVETRELAQACYKAIETLKAREARAAADRTRSFISGFLRRPTSQRWR